MGGGSSKIETNYSTKDKAGYQYYAQFDSAPFSEGVSRYAFKGTLKGGGPKSGKPCVVKVFKRSYAKRFDEWIPDLAASETAAEWAERFSDEVIPIFDLSDYRAMEFIVPVIAKVDDKTMEQCFGRKNSMIKPQEYLSLEDYIDGSYVKFNSNGGYEKAEMSAVMPAFTHWTWHQSGKRLMICDIQGVKRKVHSGYHYHLTDPAIHSIDQLYGITDLGIEGMERVLAGHHCNYICRRLHLDNPVEPDRHLFPSKKASTYDFELDSNAIRKNKMKRSKYFTPMSAIGE